MSDAASGASSNRWWEYYVVRYFVGTIVGATALDRFRGVTQFYWQLSEARAVPSRAVAEYKESYRHLREHGNAFAIILMEIAFSLLLSAMPDRNAMVVAVVIWIVPATLAWAVGAALETRLAYAKWARPRGSLPPP